MRHEISNFVSSSCTRNTISNTESCLNFYCEIDFYWNLRCASGTLCTHYRILTGGLSSPWRRSPWLSLYPRVESPPSRPTLQRPQFSSLHTLSQVVTFASGCSNKIRHVLLPAKLQHRKTNCVENKKEMPCHMTRSGIQPHLKVLCTLKGDLSACWPLL